MYIEPSDLEGCKKIEQQKLYAGIVPMENCCPRIVAPLFLIDFRRLSAYNIHSGLLLYFVEVKDLEYIDMDSLLGRDCYGGLDLSSTGDITALVLVFPPRNENEKYILVPYFWIPEDTIPIRVRRARCKGRGASYHFIFLGSG